MSSTPTYPQQGTGPSRSCCFDWLSISRKLPNDERITDCIAATKAAVRSAFGYGETRPMKRPGNFGEGEEFVRVGGSLRYTKYTLAALNDWHEEGRCVGWMNLTLRGSTGIGRLTPSQAVSFFSSLADLGYSVVRRIDCTIDVFDDEELTVEMIREKFRAGAWKIPRRDPLTYTWHGPVCSRPKGQDEGSLYLGPNSASSRVVIYNKGAQRLSERPWVRFELRSTREHADGLWTELKALSDAIFESGAAEARAADFITAAVRSAADIYDVTSFPNRHDLPKNWTRSPMAKTPPELDPLFAAVQPVVVGDLRVRGGYASAVRHMAKNSCKTIWKMCLVMVATGQDPGKGFLMVGVQAFSRLTSEDFEEMARDTNLLPQRIEEAELEALNLAMRYDGIDGTFTSSDKLEFRKQVAATCGGVQ